ncbi:MULTISPECIES: phosphoadenosine phosphosulfate reductase family protein [Mycobacteriaceae]|jgi:3'-phosphoadenosine 5'-phosphosulfate sulfotransferase (PAPS reductase)/FAD synthetase|uniref:Phosphoadenosine phosphosulfate reductase n=1 Tax=Mycolicibacterium holsaticum TaxID=152142 RepID=A0A1E3S0C2_9MYCO|nr:MULTISPECIES: phosphoadenosine phosphosulfate reductase family protein [Mycobacteriaceae]MCF6391265.1 phosphoadenosine phosphosulfate reductase family protein [Mycobacterium sp. MBM]ODQ95559.1 phosphoadenosine phosphosulfate reductase [Mycolicibacterium holsaticum]UXA21244.1 phosphoadenosine phosphosulfate reductase family protein [Mycobacterium sp. SMC-4]
MATSATTDRGTVTAGDSPDLRSYDWILVSSSAGKDSQAALDVVAEAASQAGALDRVVVVHADLGEAEWDGVPELAAEHAAHYGLRFELARRERDGALYTILDHVQQRGMWPSSQQRWCTSDFKRGPIRKVMTKLVAELRDSDQVVGRPVHLLNVMGLRAEESSARARRQPYAPNPSASNGRRRVDDWYPIHELSTTQVWQRVRSAGTRPHPAYLEGMSRLSCRFCVLASRADLVCSARLNPELARRYAAVETQTGHRFRADLSMADIIAEAAAGEQGAFLDLAELHPIGS